MECTEKMLETPWSVRRWPALRKHVDEEDKTTVAICDTGSNYKSQAVLVNEPGLRLSDSILATATDKKLAETVRKRVVCGMRNLVVSKIFCIFVG